MAAATTSSTTSAAPWTMKVPLVARAQVRMLAEGVTDAAPPAASVPDDLRRQRMFTAEQIRSALPEPGGFGWHDLRISDRARLGIGPRTRRAL
jgi:hypothetical protein